MTREPRRIACVVVTGDGADARTRERNKIRFRQWRWSSRNNATVTKMEDGWPDSHDEFGETGVVATRVAASVKTFRRRGADQ